MNEPVPGKKRKFGLLLFGVPRLLIGLGVAIPEAVATTAETLGVMLFGYGHVKAEERKAAIPKESVVKK